MLVLAIAMMLILLAHPLDISRYHVAHPCVLHREETDGGLVVE